MPAHRGYDRRVNLQRLIFQRLFLLCLSLQFAACAEPPLGVKIPFAAVWGEQSISCSDEEFALTDLRFFVSEVALVDSEGRSHPVTLDEQYQWQQADLALVDLEDGKGACQNGSRDVYSYLVGSVPPGIYRGLRFEVGVPFERNHANRVTAAAPLDVAEMYWHSGYKFMRAGLRSPTDSFWIHLGSTGCQGTNRDITGCTFPNRVSVELPDFVPRQHTIAVDLKALAGASLQDGAASDCSSGPAESSCVSPFMALGINFDTGEIVGPQRIFSLQP